MKKKIIKRVVAVLALSLIAIGSFAQSKTIRVLYHNGAPIVGATVSRYTSGWGGNVSTDENGEVTFTDGTRFQVSYNNTSFIDNYSLDGGTVTVYTTLVTIKGYDDTRAPLAGITNSYYTGAVRTFGATDASGVVSKELFPDTYSFTSTYNSTSHVRSVAIDGDGYTENTETIIETYLSRVTFKATSFQNANVSGVSISYYTSGYINLPATDVNGESSRLLYPGEHTRFKASINVTSTDEFSITVPGDASVAETPAAKKVTIPLHPIRVKFDNYDQPSNTGKVSYYPSSGLKTISGDTYYMFPGKYELRFPLKGTSTLYKRDVEITDNATHNYQKVVSIIRLTDHSGAPLTIGSIRGGYGTIINYHVSTATNKPSPVSNDGDHVWIDLSNTHTNTSRIFEVTKNGSLKTESKDVFTNNLFDFQTKLMTLRLETCNGTGLQGGTIRYGAGTAITSHWGASTDVNGETNKDLFEGDFIIEMTCNSSAEMRTVTFAGNETIIWTTTNVKLNYPGEIAYGKGSISRFFTKPTSAYGQMELLPGTLKISFRNSGENIVDFEIPEGGCVNIEKTAVIARLVNSANAPLSGGIVRYYQGGWYYNQATTAANGNGVILLNGNAATATVAMDHLGTVQQKSDVNLASLTNNTIIWQTIPVALTLKDQDGFPLEADNGTVQFYAGGWKPFADGNTTGGAASMELLPVSYSYAMNLNGTRQQFSNATATTIEFTAKKLHIYYQNDCDPVSGANASYYAGSWRSLGTTDANGNSKAIDLLPGGTISIKVGTAPQINGVAITTHPDQVVTVGECVRTD